MQLLLITSALCLPFARGQYLSTVGLEGSASSVFSSLSSSGLLTSTSAAAPTYTPAPWLSNLAQETIVIVESFIVEATTIYKTFSFVVPNASQYLAAVAAYPAPATITVQSCATDGSNPGELRSTSTPKAATVTATGAVAGTKLSVIYEVHTTTFVTSTLIYSTITDIVTNSLSYPGFPAAGTSAVVQTLTDTLTYTITEVTTETINSLENSSTTEAPEVTGNVGIGAVVTTSSPIKDSQLSSSSFTDDLRSTLHTSEAGLHIQSSSTTMEETVSSSFSLSTAPLFQSSSVPSIATTHSSNSEDRISTLIMLSSSSATTLPSTPSSLASSMTASLPGSTSSVMASTSSSVSLFPTMAVSATSQSSSVSSSCPVLGTIAASASAPSPPAGVNVYNIPGNAPYSVSEADLLSYITFPNGFNCLNKLLILQPGTAVPAMDTFSNTFIPAFEAADLPGGVDIMVVSNPSISLAAAWITAEYIAYAMDYANLVLNRPGTVVAWSQGNINVQWAFKYWPSTRTNVEGRNYVGMSPDYDGTILASFLCEPISVLTGGTGETVVDDFITDGGLSAVLAAIGLSGLPTDASDLTDPVAFKGLLLSLLYGDAATIGFSGVSSSSSQANSPTSTILSNSGLLPSIAFLDPLASHTSELSIPTSVPNKKRALPFGNKLAAAQALEKEMRSRQELMKRQNSLTGDLGTLLSGLLGPLALELSDIIVNPDAEIMQIFANIAKLVTDTPQFSLAPSGCNPAVWDQTYFSNFINVLAEDGGALAYVPTTTVFSITDEIVQPQGITGEADASGFMSGSNPGVIAPSNIFIQAAGQCSVITNLLAADAPPIISHEGVLASGMGVSAAILAVMNGGTVSYDQIVTTYGQTEACALISKYLTIADFLGNEATIPGAGLRITVNPGTTDPDAQFVPNELPLPSYAT